MPSPFPGMDPYLEQAKFWPEFHSHMMNTLFQAVVPGLLERYRARVLERVYTLEQVLFTSVSRQEHREPYLEIRQRTDHRLVSLIEVVSPANKTSAASRQQYLDKRHDAQRHKANVVEIDVVLEGQRLHDFTRESLPAWDYSVVVTRAARPEQYELYTATLDKRLPRFRLPLAADDRDNVIDLQAVLHRVYDVGDFASRVDYKQNAITHLTTDQETWIDERLREQGVRT
jgi:Protein of unknown function (DUF4058)